MHPPLRDGYTQSAPLTSSNGKTQSPCDLQVGQTFIPRHVLNSGVFVPDALLASRLVSNGAKLLWARLARYAGTNGQCFPLLSTLAADLGFSERQVQRYLAELVSGGFLRAHQRGYNKSNVYEFLWHAALAPAARTERTERQTHNSLQEGNFSLLEVVEKPFRPFQPAVPEELAGAGREEGATTLASCSTTDLSSCVSTTDLSSGKNVFKNCFEEMQAKPSRVVEVVEVPAGPACPSHEKAKSQPLTHDEIAVRDRLLKFQSELKVAGTILPSTVRKVMDLVPEERLTEALRFVAGKLYWRRRNEPSYRLHVGWGFVFQVIEQDFATGHKTATAEKRPVEPLVNPPGPTPPPSVSQQCPSRSPRQHGGFVRAGDILGEMGLLEMVAGRDPSR